MTLNTSELKDILAFAVSLSHRAGDLILEGSKAIRTAAGQGVGEKKNAVDLVTEWDVKVEEMIKREVAAAYPSFKFMGEESYSSGDRQPLTDEPTFCVDPIDGTTNFVHGFPYVCVSIGLILGKVPVLGVIRNPFLNQTYSALKGHGAFLNETSRLPLYPPAPLPSLSSAIIGSEWGSDRSDSIINAKARSFMRLAADGRSVPGGKMAHALRSIGSAAMNYALVSSGALDIYWEIGCWPWDVCAGMIIATESGAMVSGGPNDGSVPSVINEAVLTGRKYIVVRAIQGTSTESGADAQRRIIKEYYETVEDWEAS
ncbi:hypothetical protein BOTBODRAFT_63897 [Botryobasidium botryosum FD-172 SS1]|uniref:Inositol-1-monophosphatase n=1 Tax=Botryobasidium botryosum (strain FD-172 SS1) TaxID=930990 RepID=A0A067MRI1_BOTB1|nr:hypothetical protein BOTBODRAFT_63897 [Botryobasidium botryosum FD-172 SS1]